VEELRASSRHEPSDARVGAIAGTGGWWGGALSAPHNGTVALRSAWSGARHRAAIPLLHSLLPASRGVAASVAAFLRNGRFPERAA
jgi:hypothetical protein